MCFINKATSINKIDSKFQIAMDKTEVNTKSTKCQGIV